MGGFAVKQPDISGNLIINGTIEGKHVKAETITANKFSGAVEELYRCYASTVYAPTYGSFATILEFDHPATEWDIAKGRSIDVSCTMALFAGTSSNRVGTVTFQQEIQVPNFWNPSPIAGVTHDSQPEQYWQRVVMDGNQLNKFPSNMVMSDNSGSEVYRTYKNLRFVYDYEGSELVVNGGFSGTSGWTEQDGTLSVPYYGKLTGISGNANKAQISQAVNVTSGKKYRLSYFVPSGSDTYKIIVSTSTDPDDEIEYQGGLAWTGVQGTNVREFIVDTATVYIIIQNIAAGDDVSFFDNISLKELQPKTYVDISAYPSNLIPSTGSYILYSGLTTGATAGTWVIAQSVLQTVSNDSSYSKYENIHFHTYLGRFHRDMKCRLRFKHAISGLSSTQFRAYATDISLHSRIVG